MNFIQIFMIQHDYTGIHLYFFIAFISALIRYPIVLLNLKIAAHSDGGGHDAGTSHSYVPTLKQEESVPYESDGYYSYGKRGLIASWLILPFIPLYWAFQFIFVMTYITCRLEYFFSYGHISSLVCKSRYD